MTPGPIAIVLLPLLCAIVSLLCWKAALAQRCVFIAGSAACALASLWLVYVASDGTIEAHALGGWPAPFGIVLVVDMLSALMLAVTGLITFAAALYIVVQRPPSLGSSAFIPVYFFLLTGIHGAFTTGDLFNLFVWFEVILLSSFVLLVMGYRREQLEGAIKYVTINLLSSAFFLIAAGLIYGKTGTLNFADLHLKLQETTDTFFLSSSALLLLLSFAIKAALFPFYFWLPASYHTLSAGLGAFFAGLLTKVGLYAMIRIFGGVFSTTFESMEVILVALALLTMLSGVLGAAAHFEIKRILSFHIISQVGYIALGLAFNTALGITAAVFYTLHHMIVKSNLFLIGGVVEKRLGSAHLKHTGGLYAKAPLLAALFFIPAFSLGGIPPLSGFWAKLGIVRAGIEAGNYLAVGIALAVGVLTLFSMTKIWAEAFWKAPPEAEPAPEDAPPAQAPAETGWRGLYAPIALLAVVTVGFSFGAAGLWQLSTLAAEQILDFGPYTEAVLGADAP